MKNMKNFIIHLLILVSSYYSFVSAFTLTEIEEYAARVAEFPKADIISWYATDYTSYNYTIMPNPVFRIINKLGFFNDNFTPMQFRRLLKSNLERITQQGTNNTLVTTITCNEPCRWFVWSSLFAAFHSLVRSLSYLHEQKIIDDDLKIVDPSYYFVFHGDAIDRGPYSMQVLIVILALTEKNPHQVFYVEGTHESRNNWRNHSLAWQVSQFSNAYHLKTAKLLDLMSTYFATLPHSLLINTVAEPKNILLFNSKGLNSNWPELVSLKYITPQTPGITYHSTSTVSESEKDTLAIQAVIQTDNWKQPRALDGLGLLDQSYGATAWAVFSSPTEVHRTHLKFNYDAFAVIDIADTLSHSTITLYNRSLDQVDNVFTQHEPYNILTQRMGKLATALEENITLGSSMSLFQGVPVMGRASKLGVSLAINNANRTNFIDNIHIRLDIRNDNYTPNLARQNINTFLNDAITSLILTPIGSPTLAAYRDLIVQDKILVLFPVTGGSQFHQPELKGIVHLCGTYKDEVQALMEHIIKEYQITDFAFFYQDDDYGQGPLQTAHEIIEQNSLTKSLDLGYIRGNIDFYEQIQKIKSSQVESIGFFATSQAAMEFIRQLGMEGISNKILFGISFLADHSFRYFMKRRGLNILLGARVPNPNTSQLPIVQEYRAAMDEYNYLYDVFSLECYMATQFTLECIKNSKGDTNNIKPTLQKYIESLDNFNFKGLNLTFNPQTRTLGKYIWLETDDEHEWIQKEVAQ